MSISSFHSVLISAATCLAVIAVVRLRTTLPAPVMASSGSVDTRHSVSFAVRDDSLADAEDVIVTNDPFRLSNTAAHIRYDPATDGATVGASPAPALLRPVLVLKAIVGGPPWQAVVDGIPGQPVGTFVSTGSRFDKLLIKGVTADSVVVQGPDTSWVLSFRKRS